MCKNKDPAQPKTKNTFFKKNGMSDHFSLCLFVYTDFPKINKYACHTCVTPLFLYYTVGQIFFFFFNSNQPQKCPDNEPRKKKKEAQISHKRPNSTLYGVTIIGTFFSLSADLTTHKSQMPDVLTK